MANHIVPAKSRRLSFEEEQLLIKWMRGKTLQFYRAPHRGCLPAAWQDYCEPFPPGVNDRNQWRVKPEPPPDVVYNIRLVWHPLRPHFPRIASVWKGDYPASATDQENLRVVFDGATGQLKKAEVV